MGENIWDDVEVALPFLDAARRLGYSDLRIGTKQKSPFRHDKHAGSFSIFRLKDQPNFLGFKDHACPEHRGRLFNFVMLALNCDKGKAAEWLFEQSGVDRDKYQTGKTEFKQRMKENRSLAYEDRDARLHTLEHFKPALPVPDEVAEQWRNGSLAGDPERADRIAESRGWDVDVVEALIDRDLIASPALPWRNERQPAFKVQQPVYKSGKVELVDVGYHQRFVMRAKGEGADRKGWLYVPWSPDKEPKREEPQLMQALRRLKMEIHPLPFVVGCLDKPSLVVICEGQWDAVTYAAASGWLDWRCDNPPPVFGLRGAHTVACFLSFYARWLSFHNPDVLIVGDNDDAGKGVAQRRNTDKIHEEFCFVDYLRAHGAGRVIFQTIRKKHGKDFNDFYKQFHPDPDYMRRAREALGINV